MLVRPRSTISDIAVDAISASASAITVSSALLFAGSIDKERFEVALQSTVDVCPWLVGALTVTNGKLFVSPRKEGDPEDSPAIPGYLCCEVFDRSSECMVDSKCGISDFLPAKVHVKMIRTDLAFQSLEELPIAAFAITQFADHFVLGYRLNHTFYDQHSICYLLQYLANVYSHHGKATIAAPVFRPCVEVVAQKESFADETDFLAATPKGYSTEPVSGLSFDAPLTLTMAFHNSAVSALKACSAKKTLSTNDILHGTLLQAFARCNGWNPSSSDASVAGERGREYKVHFARNMRSPCALSAQTVGNYVRVEACILSEETVFDDMNTNPIRLSERNRELLEKEDYRREYPRECAWFRDFAHFRPNNTPSSTFLVDPYAATVANWSTFAYDSIAFDGSVPLELILDESPGVCPRGCFVRVTFRGVGQARQVLAIVYTSREEYLKALREIGEETELFECL